MVRCRYFLGVERDDLRKRRNWLRKDSTMCSTNAKQEKCVQVSGWVVSEDALACIETVVIFWRMNIVLHVLRDVIFEPSASAFCRYKTHGFEEKQVKLVFCFDGRRCPFKKKRAAKRQRARDAGLCSCDIYACEIFNRIGDLSLSYVSCMSKQSKNGTRHRPTSSWKARWKT